MMVVVVPRGKLEFEGFPSSFPPIHVCCLLQGWTEEVFMCPGQFREA